MSPLAHKCDMLIPTLQSGPQTIRSVVNALVRAVNGLLAIRGDRYIQVSRSPVGLGVSLNIEHVMEHLRAGGGATAGSSVRLAYCLEDAPSASTVHCALDDPEGEVIIVTCLITGATTLDEAVPRLETNAVIPVARIGQDWYCTSMFIGYCAGTCE